MNRNEIGGGNLIRWIKLDDFYKAVKFSEGIVIRRFWISFSISSEIVKSKEQISKDGTNKF